MFKHWSIGVDGTTTGPPYEFVDDGILDTRLVVSPDGINLHYSDAANGRSSFLPLGVNECGPTASAPGVKGGWCNPFDGTQRDTSFDTSNVYMASGFVPSTDGNEIYLYYAGEPFTHGDDLTNHTFGNNTGVGMVRLRRDGFVSVDSPTEFYKASDREPYPSLTTTAVRVPTDCAVDEELYVVVNAVTSVVGWVALEIMQQGTAVPGYELSVANPLVGNFVRARATWGNGTVAAVTHLAGREVAFRVAMADASLYSIALRCSV